MTGVQTCALPISTIALESIILGKPTISLVIEDWAFEEDIIKSGAVLAISQIEEFEPKLRKLLTDKQFRMELYEKSQKFVESYLTNRGTASLSLVRELDKF